MTHAARQVVFEEPRARPTHQGGRGARTAELVAETPAQLARAGEAPARDETWPFRLLRRLF